MSTDSNDREWVVELGHTRCRFCHIVLPPQLGWLYYDELTHVEIRQLCGMHLEGLLDYFANHKE